MPRGWVASSTSRNNSCQTIIQSQRQARRLSYGMIPVEPPHRAGKIRLENFHTEPSESSSGLKAVPIILLFHHLHFALDRVVIQFVADGRIGNHGDVFRSEERRVGK